MAALGKPRDLSPDLTYHRHRASARPYFHFPGGLSCWVGLILSGRCLRLGGCVGIW